MGRTFKSNDSSRVDRAVRRMGAASSARVRNIRQLDSLHDMEIDWSEDDDSTFSIFDESN